MEKTEKITEQARDMIRRENAEKEGIEIQRILDKRKEYNESEKVDPDNFNDSRIFQELQQVLEKLRNYKPNERSEKSRRYAVTITEMEKVLSYFKVMVVDHNS